MRLLSAAALAILAASAVLAPKVHGRRVPASLDAALYDVDPRARIERGRRDASLGAELSGYEQLWNENPGDLEALRGRFRLGLKLGAIAFAQPGVADLVRLQVDDYLKWRDRVDPDGTLLQDTLADWVDLRLRHEYFYAKTSAAIFLAARGAERGAARIRGYLGKGPFHGEFCRYMRRHHIDWRAVRPVLQHYLEQGDLAGRVQAGATLLEYHDIHGEGRDLLDRFLPEIRAAFHEAVTSLEPTMSNMETFDRGNVALLGLAVLRGPRETRLLRELREIDVPHYAKMLRLARVWAGIEPLSSFGPASDRWQFMDGEEHEIYFRGAAHAYAREMRRPEGERDKKLAQEAFGLMEGELVSPDVNSRIHAFYALASLDPAGAADRTRSAVRGGGALALHASLLLPEGEDRVPYLLPGLAAAGVVDLQALAAVYLLAPDRLQ
ncbi:MAG: hypothetical protein ACREID_09240 [Planctomycetota bacterium]